MSKLDRDLHKKIKSMDGAITIAEYKRLHDMAKNVRSGWIVEIGSYRGCSTVALAMGSKHGHRVPVLAVEPHEDFAGVLGGHYGWKDRKEFFQNMVRWGVCDTVRLANLSSEVVAPQWDKPVSLLWIDGDHTYEGVKRDFELWSPHVPDNGTVAIHDCHEETLGPARLVSEVVSDGRFKVVDMVFKMAILKRV